MRNLLIILSLLGILFSIYAFYVERKHMKQKSYKPICDFSKNISCTKAFSSPEGAIFGISNSIVGIIFYTVILISAFYNQLSFVFRLSLLAAIASVYLFYVSFIKMKNFCLVCTSVYLINLLLFVFSYFEAY